MAEHSPTKRRLSAETVARECLGRSFDPAECREIGSAGFACVWRVGETLVLKCAPPPKARLLAYERGLLGHEAAIFRRIEESPDDPFLVGYGVELDDAACTRLCLYRLHLYLVMLVELPSRGMTGLEAESRRDHVAGQLADENSLLG